MLSLPVNDRDLAVFTDGLFRYADESTFVSWRAFRDDRKDAPPVFIHATPFTTVDELATIAAGAAHDAATRPYPVVFCPPIATFINADRARESDLANGLALSVECDAQPTRARELLESVLGPATVVVASGGVTADGEPKLHLHWRLTEPTDDAASHAQLKLARRLAVTLAGGDATNVPLVHPIRWPGSVHRKADPRLAKIVAANLDREIELSTAVEALTAAVPQGTPTPIVVDGDPTSTAALITELLSGQSIHQPLVQLAMRYLKGGMSDPQCVLTLRGLLDAIPLAVRNRPDQPDRWASHYKDVPRTVRTAREKIPVDTPVDLSGFLAAPNIIAARTPDPIPEIPAHLLAPPGILNDIVAHGIATSVRPIPIFSVQGALAIGSVVCGRRYVTTHRNYSSLYFLNVARSGTGKEEAKRLVERVLAAAGARRLVGPSRYSSGTAVFSGLLKKPQHVAIIDEFGKYLESATSRRESWTSDALNQLIEAFGRVDGDMIPPQFSTMNLSAAQQANADPKVVVRPALTLLGMTTPSTFYTALRSTQILDGFLNRFLIVEHAGPRQPSADFKDEPVPAAVVDWVTQLLAPKGNVDVGTQVDTIGPATMIGFSPKAFEATRAFEHEMLALAESLEADGLGDLPIRSREIAMRLSLIVALSDTPDTPLITEDCTLWANDYVRFFLQQTIGAVRSRVADSETARVRNQILLVIRQAGELGITDREFFRRKDLFAIRKSDRIDALESLQAAELIQRVTMHTAGRLRTAWVAVDETAEMS